MFFIDLQWYKLNEVIDNFNFNKNNCCGIYIIKNLINNKVYVGQSVNIYRRILRHKNEPSLILRTNRNTTSILYRSILKNGIDNFVYSIIIECNKSELNTNEKKYIRDLNSNKKSFGYNKTDEDFNNHRTLKISLADLEELKYELLNGDISIKELSKKYGISIQNIYHINEGYCHFDYELSYPLRDLNVLYDLKCVTCNNLFESKYKITLCCSARCDKIRKGKIKNTNYKERTDIEKSYVEDMMNYTILNGFNKASEEYSCSPNAIKNKLKKFGLYEEFEVSYYRNKILKTKSKLKFVIIKRCKDFNSYIVNFWFKGSNFYFGAYRTIEEAAKVADEKMLEIFGEDVLTNKKLGLIDY